VKLRSAPLVARLAGLLALYLAGVALGLLLLFFDCDRCQQDNAYIGLTLIPLLFALLGGILAAVSLVLGMGGSTWLVAASIVIVPLVMFGALSIFGFPVAISMVLLVDLSLGLVLSYRLHGGWTVVVSVAAATLSGLLARLRGVQVWGTVGIDGALMVVVLLLALTIVWLGAARRRGPDQALRPRRP
jgi:hypothetical protein